MLAVIGIAACRGWARDEAARPEAPVFESLEELDAYFGAVVQRRWVGQVPAGDGPVAFQLHVVEAEYSDYEVMQSRQRLADRSRAVAVLMLPQRSIILYGRRYGKRMVLIDMGLLIDPDRMTDDWEVLVEHLSETSQAGGRSAEGCPWSTRAAFVHTLQDLEAAEVYWYTDEYEFDERAQRMIEEQTGVRRNADEFRQDIIDTFGSIQGANLNCCPLPEVLHTPLRETDSPSGRRLIGTLVQYMETDRTKPLVNRVASRVGLPDAGQATSLVLFDSRYVLYGEAEPDDFRVTLKRFVAKAKEDAEP